MQGRPESSGRLYFFAVITTIEDPLIFKAKALQWAASFDVCCYLDSNNFDDPYSKFDCLLAAGAKDQLIIDAGTAAFDQLENFRRKNTGWVTGFFGYDLKNETERLTSENPDQLNFPDLYFFAPECLIVINPQFSRRLNRKMPGLRSRKLKYPSNPVSAKPNTGMRLPK